MSKRKSSSCQQLDETSKEDDGRDGWGEEGSMQGKKKNMGEWRLPEKKKLEMNERGQYTNARGVHTHTQQCCLPVLVGMQSRSCIWMQRWCQPLSDREGSKFISHWHRMCSSAAVQLICSETEANCFTALGCSYNTVNLTQLSYGIATLEQISNGTSFPASVNSSCSPSPPSPVETR